MPTASGGGLGMQKAPSGRRWVVVVAMPCRWGLTPPTVRARPLPPPPARASPMPVESFSPPLSPPTSQLLRAGPRALGASWQIRACALQVSQLAPPPAEGLPCSPPAPHGGGGGGRIKTARVHWDHATSGLSPALLSGSILR